jgi:hypothetical protein
MIRSVTTGLPLHSPTDLGSTTTFVTAFIQIYDESSNDIVYGGRDTAWRYAHFRTLAESGVPICVYVDEREHANMTEFAHEFSNIWVMPPKSLSQTWSHACVNVYKTGELTRPALADSAKDSNDYMTLIVAKTEWVADAARINPWRTPHFAWIDFSIAHVFQDIPRCQSEIRRIASCGVTKEDHDRFPGKETDTPFLCIPGSGMYSTPLAQNLSEMSHENLLIEFPLLLNVPCWRFCGGLFVGDALSIIEFDALCRTMFPVFLDKYRRIVWEVNLWSWIESAVPTWKPIWYKADHQDDTMFTNFPQHLPI